MGDNDSFPCQICGEWKGTDDMVPAARIRAPVANVIRRENPGWSADGYICRRDLDRFRLDYLRDALETETAEYSSLEQGLRQGWKDEDHIPKNINVEFEKELTLGERLADRLAGFAGSWTFIAVFAFLIFLWVILNTYLFLARPFDPYPYILLNLVLSILTAVQAPVIIMSQNRQEVRDRLHAERDYQVSIHTELEIHRLHKKIDHLLAGQGRRLLEIQNIQVELLEELARNHPGQRLV